MKITEISRSRTGSCGSNPGAEYTHLEITDRVTGEVERIRLGDANSDASVALAAERCGINEDAAWETLRSGGSLHTAGFSRRLISLD